MNPPIPTRFILFSILSFLSLSPLAHAIPFTVKSFNIRNSNQSSWNSTNPFGGADRRDRVVASILADAPDIVGLQEVLPNQAEDLAEDLAPSGYIGISQPREEDGEASTLFFKPTRFALSRVGHFWLNLAPDLPIRHPLDGANESPRITTWAELLDLTDNRSYFVANTHFPQLGQPDARNGELVATLNDIQRAGILAFDTHPQN